MRSAIGACGRILPFLSDLHNTAYTIWFINPLHLEAHLDFPINTIKDQRIFRFLICAHNAPKNRLLQVYKRYQTNCCYQVTTPDLSRRRGLGKGTRSRPELGSCCGTRTAAQQGSDTQVAPHSVTLGPRRIICTSSLSMLLDFNQL